MNETRITYSVTAPPPPGAGDITGTWEDFLGESDGGDSRLTRRGGRHRDGAGERRGETCRTGGRIAVRGSCSGCRPPHRRTGWSAVKRRLLPPVLALLLLLAVPASAAEGDPPRGRRRRRGACLR
ncbi:hypothetical protein [Methanoculleus chikugoensis]|uniref:hypothetical protein n=1 Tax=Methanoculleus chikugoensis TaxID=118126 RepID=UPI001FB33B9E|nr:hypothetical protein [Methanoculleus chikugoensis]